MPRLKLTRHQAGHLAMIIAAVTGCPDGVTRPTAIARLEIVSGDTAAVVGTALQLSAVAHDSAGRVVGDARIAWASLDTTRARVSALTGLVWLGPNPGDALVISAEPRSGAADTVSVHAAAEGEVRWTFSVTGQMNNMAGPAIGPDGTIYVLSVPFPGTQEVADVHALSASGVPRWSLRIDRTSANGLLVAPDGTVYVTGRTVRAINPDGGTRWEHILAGASSSAFIVGAVGMSGPLIVAGEDSPIALDRLTGDTAWVGPVSPVGAWLVPPTLVGGTAWIKRTADSLFAFAVATGTMQRGIAEPDSGVADLAFGAGPVVVGAALYVPTAFRLGCVDTAGTFRWATDYRGRGVSEPVVDAVGNLYLQMQADGLVRRDPATGVVAWRRPALEPRWAWYGGPALAQGGVLYAAAIDGFYAYDTAGQERWAFQSDEGTGTLVPFVGAPAIGADGTVYTYSESRVYAFWGGRPPEAQSPWPMWRGDARRSGVAPHP
jgi:outer membrane protein assembly factor BamB